MCRFVYYSGEPITLSSLVTEPEHSIIHQSYQSRERKEPLNGDGFGVAWYADGAPEEPAVFKDVSPAWSNQNLLNIARVVKSRCIFAHVRAATAGLAVIRPNCHPFAWRRYAFMHNGFIGEFRKIRRALQAELSDAAFAEIHGNTDSEHIFALFIDEALKHGEPDTAAEMAECLRNAMRRAENVRLTAGIARHSQLNIAVTDGSSAVVTRYVSDPAVNANSLYIAEGSSYACEAGESRLTSAGGTRKRAVLIASEPLGSDGNWQSIAANRMVLVDAGHRVSNLPLEL